MGLMLYRGYELNVDVKKSSLAVGNLKLCLSSMNDKLEINLFYRNFDDVSIVKSKVDTILAYR